MKYYAREVTKREPVNKYGRMGTPLYIEYFKTNSDDVLVSMNFGKRIKFKETQDANIIRKLRSLKADELYSEKKSEC